MIDAATSYSKNCFGKNPDFRGSLGFVKASGTKGMASSRMMSVNFCRRSQMERLACCSLECQTASFIVRNSMGNNLDRDYAKRRLSKAINSKNPSLYYHQRGL